MAELKQEFKNGNVAATAFYHTMRQLTDQHTKLRAKTVQATLSQRQLNEEIYDRMRGKATEGVTQQASAFGLLSRRVVPVVAAYGLLNQAQKGMQDQFRLDKAQRQIEVFTGSSAAANRLTTQMEKLAAQTPLTFEALSSASGRLLGAKVASEDLMDTMRRLGDIAQGNNDTFKRLSLAYSQVLSNGRLMQEEANQMADTGFPLLTLMAEQTGESMVGLRDRIRSGGVAAAEVTKVIQRLTDEGGLYGGGLAKSAEQAEGKFGKLADSVGRLRRNLTSIVTGPLAELSTLITTPVDKINSLFATMRENVRKVRGETSDHAKVIGKAVEAQERLNTAMAAGAAAGEPPEKRWVTANRAVHELIMKLDEENQRILHGNREYERRQLFFRGATEDKLRSLEMTQKQNDALKEQVRLEEERKNAAQRTAEELARKAEELKDQFKSPFEKMIEELKQINQMNLDLGVREQAIKSAANRFNDATQPRSIELPPSITKGSREEYKLLAERQNKTAQEALRQHQERMAVLIAQKLAAEKTAEAAERTAEASEQTRDAVENLEGTEAI
ncbi:tape measure protein [Rhodopirellula sp. JC639]|uniref:tape measure protein n=1 Tax=Stieleria mannarensis TaxID=2755585 RepID=UPI0015FF402D|nr:tape measure protein [Rhodopirellula sp. JC639]